MNPRTKTSTIVMIRKSVFTIAAFTLMLSSAASSQNSKQQFDDALKFYNAANFDKAISILAKLAEDRSADNALMKEVLLTLGRSYTAKGNKEKAMWAMTRLIDLEPPTITPDPDAECPPLMRIYYEARKAKSGSTVVERPDPGLKTIAILDFKNRSIDDKEKFDPMEKGFAELMIDLLNGSVNLKVIERERIQWILDEIGLENDPGKFDQSSAVRVGKQLGVHSILLGSFIKAKSKMELLARLVKVETSEIIATERSSGDADEFFDLAQNMSINIAKKINASLSEAEIEKRNETKSLDAMMSYSEGLVDLEKGNYKAAYDKFIKALQFDPTYDKARMKAASIKPLVG